MGFKDFLGNLPVVGPLFGGGYAGDANEAADRLAAISEQLADRGMKFHDDGQKTRDMSRSYLEGMIASGPQQAPDLSGLINRRNPFAGQFNAPTIRTAIPANVQFPGSGGAGPRTPGTSVGPRDPAAGGGGWRPGAVPAPAGAPPAMPRPGTGGGYNLPTVPGAPAPRPAPGTAQIPPQMAQMLARWLAGRMQNRGS